MAIKVIVCGEGPTDVGKKDCDTSEWIPGPAIAYIKNASTPKLQIDGIQKNKLPRIQKAKCKKGHSVKAERLCRYAILKSYKVAICYVDCDNNDFETIYQDITFGFSFYSNQVIGIPMIPKAMIESWLLADEKAFIKVFGKKPSKPPLPKKPESLWGKKEDPNSNYPKNVLKLIVSQFNNKPEDWRYALARNSNSKTLLLKCPESYGRFLCDMQKIE
ncbi:hypothetical protein [Candidatus Cloacimonas acidaminovorans]|jgi:hypothetical protein|uniref:DUF4276 family protein n=1 Tax=Cloacimonas acidaminovorans (strain Evry) TaxID=459349 RepID=B0VJ97_CLOAI|nr:hypothetical protein [Candidatus Cloacimonas acidaminovorans]CAO81540.1 hypothetical protein CLOAM1704 [Candidatus Cloacimonas acidaminovorans str. Evry]